MEIERNEEKKIISVWLTKAESRDEDLYRSTLDLLAYNKKCCAELAVKREETQV